MDWHSILGVLLASDLAFPEKALNHYDPDTVRDTLRSDTGYSYWKVKEIVG